MSAKVNRLRESLLLPAVVWGAFVYGAAIIASQPFFLAEVQALVMTAEADKFTSRGGSDYLRVTYAYEFDGD